jgi:hypothetical protein
MAGIIVTNPPTVEKHQHYGTTAGTFVINAMGWTDKVNAT